jgi:hypothetical protein
MIYIICLIVLITLLLIGLVSITIIWYCTLSFLIDYYNDNLKYKKWK